MKVGIITIHRIANYGSALQTYALQRTIENLGYNCEIIDYIYPNDYHLKLRKSDPEIVSPLRKIKEKVSDLLTRRGKKENAFCDFLSKYVKLSKMQYISIESLRKFLPKYDIYVTGSDQVWNTTYMHADTTFLLDFLPENAKRISYASSFGNSSFDPHYAEIYKKHLVAYSHLSVRESAGIKIISDLTGLSSQQVLDPTMLLSADEWNFLAVKPKLKKKYILCYFLGYAFSPQPYADILAKQLRKETGYELVLITPTNKYKIFDPTIHTVFDAGPREFLGWFANAEIVLTTSFHGSAFSIIFNKAFFSLVNNKPTLDCRQINLLEELNLQSQILPINSPVPDMSQLQLNYGKVNKRLDVMKQKSIHYLKKSIAV